ncbi:hypothetical protein COC59_20880 [Bacillus cereus]|nr:hypothetical protein COC59_20880 [Bacillus cereus]
MFPQLLFSETKQFFRNRIWMIPENVIGYNPSDEFNLSRCLRVVRPPPQHSAKAKKLGGG